MARVKTLFAPVRRLPPEILGEIFLHCVESPIDPSNPKDTSFHDPPLVLVRVCRRWYQVVYNTPRLFTSIILQGPASNADFLISKWMDYSGVLLLDITIAPEQWTASPVERQAVIRQLASNIQRIRFLRVSHQCILDYLISHCGQDFLPNLQELQLLPITTDSEGRFTPPSPEELDLWHTPMPEHVFAPNIRSMLLGYYLPGRIPIHPGSQLTIFDSLGSTRHSPDEMVKLLSTCTNLKECRMSYQEDEGDSGFICPGSLNLPLLETFVLSIYANHHNWEAPCHLCPILGGLSTPALTHLTLKGTTLRHTYVAEEGVYLVRWLSSAQKSLRSFLMYHFAVQSAALQTILAVVPHVTEVAFCRLLIYIEDVEIFNRDLNPFIFPHLEKVIFKDSTLVPGPAEFVKMAESRLNDPQGLKLPVLKQLDFISCGFSQREGKKVNLEEEFAVLLQAYPSFDVFTSTETAERT